MSVVVPTATRRQRSREQRKSHHPHLQISPQLKPTGGLTPEAPAKRFGPQMLQLLAPSHGCSWQRAQWVGRLPWGSLQSRSSTLHPPQRCLRQQVTSRGLPCTAKPTSPPPWWGTEGWWLSSCSPPTPSSEAREGRWAGCVAVGTQKASGAGLTHPRASGSHMWVPGLSCTKAGRCSMHTGQTVLSGTVEKRRGSGCLGSSPSSPLSK